MPLEAIYKFQPDRCAYIRGSDGFGAHASLCNASATGFNVYGVFRDQADFTVLLVWDADSLYEHYLIRYLPDMNVTGTVLSFSIQYGGPLGGGPQPFDSPKFSWIDWASFDLVDEDGYTAKLNLFDYATLDTSSTYVPATATVTFTAASALDECTLVVNNKSFVYPANVNTGDGVAEYFANAINETDWSTFEFADVAVTGTALMDGSGHLIITYGRTGTVTASGSTVTWVAGNKFSGLHVGDSISIGASVGNMIGGTNNLQYTVSAINSPTSLSLSSAYIGASTGSGASYLAPYGGVDGNLLTAYVMVGSGNATLTASPTVIPLSGGTSYSALWNININFANSITWATGSGYISAPITTLRQMWMTFAPALANGATYTDTEWTVNVTNWSALSGGVGLPLKCAGQNSVRVGSKDAWATYSAGWAPVLTRNDTYHGCAYETATTGASVTVKYSCSLVHDLYIGSFFGPDCGVASVVLDGTTTGTLVCSSSAPEGDFAARRKVFSSVAAGQHVVVITMTSSATNLWFDYLEAVVESDIPSITQPYPVVQTAPTALTYANISPALDYDTDQTYKQSPARIMWQLEKLGYAGDLNLYVGVFFWNQRVRGTNATFLAAPAATQTTITFSGSPNAGDNIWINLNGSIAVTSGTGWEPTYGDGTTYYKLVTALDTIQTIAEHFVYYINSGSVALWASAAASGSNWVVTLNLRSVSSSIYFTSSVRAGNTNQSSSTAIALSAIGTNQGTQVEGDWVIDPTASNPINYPTRQFLSDLYMLCAAKSPIQQCVCSFSMELVNPPDMSTSPTNPGVMSARFASGEDVQTGTGVAYNNVVLYSTQCAPVPTLTTFQESVFLECASLQNAAGLTPWLQFGEFLWWFFSRFESTAIGYVAYTSPISIGMADPHELTTGDRAIISGVQGMTAANGTWTVTVTDATHFTLNGSVPNAAWVSGTGVASSGGMAYYDSETSAAATTALGRALYSFTCQDDDPTVNSSADSQFLAERLRSHINSIRSAVLAVYSGAKFEILYPDDVNHATCIYTPAVPYPQGGRLNRAVNCPTEWLTPSTSGFDRIKVECLSWGATYRNLDLAQSAMTLFTTGAGSWSPANLAYLVSWFVSGSPWPTEFLAAVNNRFGLICFWAYDHNVLMSWPLPVPVNQGLAIL